jgi:MFS family permease
MGIIFATLERWPGREYVYMSRVIAAYSVGGLVGPGIGALGGVRAPFEAYLVLLGLAGAGVLALRGPSRPQRFSSDRTALRLPGFWTASAAGGFAVLVLGIVDGVLPLHLAEQLDQHEIGVLYAAVSALAGVSAAVAALGRPRPLILAACGLGVGGLAIAGSSSTPIVWIGARALTAIGAGLGNTGAIGLLFEAVGTERIVTAMIVWSQIGILGYLVGPLAGGVVAESAGYGAIAVVPLLVAVPVAAAPAAARFRNRAA